MGNKFETAMTFILAAIGVWQVRTWLMAGLDRWHAHLVKKIAEQERQP